MHIISQQFKVEVHMVAGFEARTVLTYWSQVERCGMRLLKLRWYGQVLLEGVNAADVPQKAPESHRNSPELFRPPLGHTMFFLTLWNHLMFLIYTHDLPGLVSP